MKRMTHEQLEAAYAGLGPLNDRVLDRILDDLRPNHSAAGPDVDEPGDRWDGLS